MPSASNRPISFLLCIMVSTALFYSLVSAQAPFQNTLKSLPGEGRPQSLSSILDYLQLIPYISWIVRNPNLWGYVLSVLPTFLSEIPSFVAYLRFYALQLPGAVNYLISFTTRGLALWVDVCYVSLCRAIGRPFSSALALSVEWPCGFVLPNIPYIIYSFLVSVPYLIASMSNLTSSLPKSLVSYASPTVGALNSISPQFIPVFLSLISSSVDWLNIFIELMPEYIVRVFFDSIMLPPRCVYDLLFSCVHCLTFTCPSLLTACVGFLSNGAKLLPYLPEVFSYINPLFEALSLAIDSLPALIVGVNLAFISGLSAFFASSPAFLVNLVSSLLMSIPLAINALFKVLCGCCLALPPKCASALICGVPAYALSVCSAFLFLTLPKEICRMIRSGIYLLIDLIGFIVSRFLALPFIVCYRCFSLPYSAMDACANLCDSLISPMTKYMTSRMTEVIS